MTLHARHWLFAGFTGAAALVHAPTLLAILDYSRTDPSASHLLLVPFVVLVLLYRDRDRIFRTPTVSWLSGGCALVLAAACALGSLAGTEGNPELRRSLAALSLVLLWIGAFASVYGTYACRVAAFPLVFLLFTVPLPPVPLQACITFLKNGTTEVVAALFTVTGVVYHREGAVFQLPTLAIEIADECSGIRSTIALVLTALLAGHMWLDKPASRLLLLLAVLPVTIMKNGIRIVVLSLLSVHVNPGFMEGQLHRDGGIAFFLLALAMLAPVLVLLRKVETSVASSAQPQSVSVS